MLDIFTWDNEELAEKVAEFYYVGREITDELINDAYTTDAFGRHGDLKWRRVLDIQLLLGVMLMIYDDMKTDENYLGAPQAKSVYYDRYNLTTIKKHFQCFGISINSLLDIFGMGSIGDYVGIDWDAVEDDISGGGSAYQVQ